MHLCVICMPETIYRHTSGDAMSREPSSWEYVDDLLNRNMPCHEKTCLRVSDCDRHNHAVQPQEMARGMKFQILKVEGLYYLCSINKGTDQLHGHRVADLCLCFCICKKQVFT